MEITVKIPKPIIDFFTAFLNFVGSEEYTAEKYLTEDCEDHIKSHVEEFIAQACNFDFYDGREEAINKYGLKPFIKLTNIGADLDKSEEES